MMLISFVLFLKLIDASITENPLRDKIKISNCESLNGSPQMTIVGPEFILDGKNFNAQTGQIIEKKINGEDLLMQTNEKCKFQILRK